MVTPSVRHGRVHPVSLSVVIVLTLLVGNYSVTLSVSVDRVDLVGGQLSGDPVGR